MGRRYRKRSKADARNMRLLRGSNGDEHRARQTGWRVADDGHLELWFSACNDDQHVGSYWPTCQFCQHGEWTRTDVTMPAMRDSRAAAS